MPQVQVFYRNQRSLYPRRTLGHGGNVIRDVRKSRLHGLSGYCLYKDGQLVPPQDTPPPLAQVPPQTTPPYEQNTVDANGQCCPQPNPISINITNSQDTNSRNTNMSRQGVRQPYAVLPGAPRIGVQRERVVRVPVVQRVPVYRNVVQRIPYPVVRQVPVEVIKQVEVPVVKNTYTERIVSIPVTGCEGKEYLYPAWR